MNFVKNKSRHRLGGKLYADNKGQHRANTYSMKNNFLNAPSVYGAAIGLGLLVGLAGSGAWSGAGLICFVMGCLLAGIHFELSGATAALWRRQFCATFFFARRPVEVIGHTSDTALDAVCAEPTRRA